jgi:hypothetical protein
MIKKYLLTLAVLFAGTIVTHAATYAGDGSAGFGGPVGNGSLQLTTDGTTVSGVFTNGLTSGGGFSDELVLYIDSTSSGANASSISSAAGFTDTADTNRKAITQNGGANTLNLPIAADFAIAISPNSGGGHGGFGGLWSLSSGASLPFVSSVSLTNIGNTFATTYSFSFLLSDIGSPAASFDFVASYLNGTNGFLSNETLAGTTGLGGSNPGSPSTVTLSGFQTFVIPEPSSVALMLGASVLGGLYMLRRKRS